jgi:hypothetical protein
MPLISCSNASSFARVFRSAMIRGGGLPSENLTDSIDRGTPKETKDRPSTEPLKVWPSRVVIVAVRTPDTAAP